MRIKYIITSLLLFGVVNLVNGQDTTSATPDKNAASEVPPYQSPTINYQATVAYQEAHNTGSLSDFVRLHPLIVHFPIVFLILAFVVQIISFFVFRRELSWVSMFLIVLGFVGAYVATNFVHGGDPVLSSLSEITRKTFEKHEQFAHYTVIVSGIASLLKIISHFFMNRKLIPELVISVVMLVGVACIHTTGDMGARLVHIDALGVQGNEIPLHDDD